MAYKCNLGSGQEVYIDNQGMQTVVTLASGGPGQQQQSSSSFQTGKWTAEPSLYWSGNRMVLRIESENGQFSIQLQAGGMSLMGGSPDMANAEKLSVQQVSPEAVPQGSHKKPMEPMKPMEPVKPIEPMKPMDMGSMKMGNMEMNMNPMQMRMGNMSMDMGNPGASPEKRFCPQCGTGIQASDRFCSSCGHQL